MENQGKIWKNAWQLKGILIVYFFRFPRYCLSQLAVMCLSQDIGQHSHHSPHQKPPWIMQLTYLALNLNSNWYIITIEAVGIHRIASYPTHFMIISFIPTALQLRCTPCSFHSWDFSAFTRLPWRLRLPEFRKPRGPWPLRHGMCQKLGNTWLIPDSFLKALREFQGAMEKKPLKDLYFGSIALWIFLMISDLFGALHIFQEVVGKLRLLNESWTSHSLVKRFKG